MLFEHDSMMSDIIFSEQDIIFSEQYIILSEQHDI